MSYVRFDEDSVAGAKTKSWNVCAVGSNYLLGHIAWYWAWRQYVFWPEMGSIWSAGCLQDVAAFVAKANAEHKVQRKERADDQGQA